MHKSTAVTFPVCWYFSGKCEITQRNEIIDWQAVDDRRKACCCWWGMICTVTLSLWQSIFCHVFS